MGFLWDFHDISMICLWDYFGMPIESRLKSNESKLKSIESKLKVN